MNIFVLISVMFLIEHFVLLRLYRRSPTLQTISLVVAPLMALVGYMIARAVLRRDPTLAEYFLFISALELPLALRGYEIKPDAKIWERVLVAGTFGTVSYAAAQLQ